MKTATYKLDFAIVGLLISMVLGAIANLVYTIGISIDIMSIVELILYTALAISIIFYHDRNSFLVIGLGLFVVVIYSAASIARIASFQRMNVDQSYKTRSLIITSVRSVIIWLFLVTCLVKQLIDRIRSRAK